MHLHKGRGNHGWLLAALVLPVLSTGCTRGPKAAATVEKAAEGEPNLVVEARAAPGGEVLKLDSIEVHRADGAGTATDEVVASQAFTSGPVQFTLEPGRYVVRAKAGAVSRDLAVEVKAGLRGVYHLVLDAGWARVRVLPKKGADPIPIPWIRALREGRDAAGEKTRQVVAEAFSTQGTHRFFLPAGAYVLRAEDDAAVSGEAPVTVRAGDLEEIDIVLDAGWLKATAVAKEGGTPVPVAWLRAQRQTRDAAGEATFATVAEAFSSGGRHRFFLPAGSYRVLAEDDAVRATAPASVKAGALSEVTVVLNAGWVDVKVVKESGGVPTPVQWIRIQREGHDAAGAPTWETVAEAFATGGTHRFFVPAGTYRAAAEDTGLAGAAAITVEPGGRTPVELLLRPVEP